MAILNEYNEIIREYFDISDTKTRKCIIALEDAQETQLLAALSSALYDKIVSHVDKIDFGSIPRSRGDITKVEGFENTLECLNIIRKLVLEYKENPETIDVVLTAIENIKSRKGIFMKAYALNVEFPMVLYNLITLCIEQSVSYLIAVCIQYIKDPASQQLSSALDKVAYKNTRDNLMFEQLAEFNKSCIGKDFDSVMSEVIKNASIKEGIDWVSAPELPGYQVAAGTDEAKPSPFIKYDGEESPEVEPEEPHYDRPPEADEQMPIHGAGEIISPAQPLEEDGIGKAIGGAFKVGETIWKNMGTGQKTGIIAVAAVLGLKTVRSIIKVIIPICRNITYFFINSRVKLSDSLAIQAQFIEANAAKLEYSSNSEMDDDKKKKVVEKQRKWAERLKNWSNKISIDNKKASKEAEKMSDDDKKDKKTIDDLKDQLPPDISTAGGLF